MPVPGSPTRIPPVRRLAVLGLLCAAAIVSCGRDVTGPLGAAARYVRGFAWNPQFPPALQVAGASASSVVQVSFVHVILHHDDGSIALDTTIDFPAGSSAATVSLTVKLLDDAPASGEQMHLTLDYLNAAGTVVFEGGPILITAAPAPADGSLNPPVQVPIAYIGPGSNAASVAISPHGGTVVAGAGFSFTAVAKDNGGQPLAGTPVVWSSLDPTVANVTSAGAGTGTAFGARGTARIVAQLLTGPADTVQLFVTLPATQVAAASGGGQTGVAGAALAQPLVVKVSAADGIGAAGVTVSFAVATGGGSLSSTSVVSDANGLAQTTWKLGPAAGLQSVSAGAGTLANSPVTFTATAQSATATKLVVTTPPTTGVAGAPLSPVVISAEDDNGNVATGFTGPVSIALGANPTLAGLGGGNVVNAIAGVATFSTLTVSKVGTGYTLVASGGGLSGATSGAFDVGVGAPSKLVFTLQPSNAIVRTPITPAIVVSAQDSQGNPTPGFTGVVSIALATSQGGATLAGTTTVNAIGGGASFGDLSVSAAGTSYSLVASAAGLTSVTSGSFAITSGAANLVLSSGGGQSATAGAALGQPIVVKVTDADGNGVAGSTVSFGVVTGGGTVSPASGVSDASGFVQAAWTLGAADGAQSMSAAISGLPGAQLTITANAAATCRRDPLVPWFPWLPLPPCLPPFPPHGP